MEKFWGKFFFHQNHQINMQVSDNKSCLRLPTGELHWQLQSPFVSIRRQQEWVIFIWGFIRDRKITISQELIIDQLMDSLINFRPLDSWLANIEGEFALVIWNENKKKLFLITDPFGITKMYYKIDGNAVVFSSHVAEVARQCGKFDYSPEGISLLLSFKGIPAPYTVVEGVSVLKPAEILEIDINGSISKNYWSILDNIKEPYTQTFEQAQSDFLSCLESSLIRISYQSTKPLGICLSSGIDSALLLGLTQKIGIPSIAFSVGYDPPGSTDESEYARKNAESIGAKIAVFHPTDAVLAELLNKAIQSMPEPISDATLLPQLYLSYAAKQSVATLLDGTGADNIFGGLQKFKAESIIKRYHRIPKFIRAGLVSPFTQLFPSSRGSSIRNWARQAQKFTSRSELTEDLRKISWSRFLTQKQVKELLHPDWHNSISLAESIFSDSLDKSASTFHELLASTYASIRITLPNHSLQKLSTLQYMTAINFHTPFITPDMVEFSLRLPDNFKLSDKKSKIVLRSAAERILPPICLDRKKANFSPPISRWLTGIFREELLDTLRSDNPFNQNQIEKMLSQQFSGWRDWQWELWMIFILLKWWEEAKNV